MNKIITTEVFQLPNDKKLDISLAVTKSNLNINNEFAILLNFQIGMEFKSARLISNCRKMLDRRALWDNVLIFMQEWFSTRKEDDKIQLDYHNLIFTEGQLKEITFHAL